MYNHLEMNVEKFVFFSEIERKTQKMRNNHGNGGGYYISFCFFTR